LQPRIAKLVESVFATFIGWGLSPKASIMPLDHADFDAIVCLMLSIFSFCFYSLCRFSFLYLGLRFEKLCFSYQ
jgi:hypothetical protein